MVALDGVERLKVVDAEVKPVWVLLAFKVTCPPAQAAVGVEVGVKLAPSMTPTLKVPVTVPQPLTLPVNVYCVVVEGPAMVIKFVDDDRPVDGLQLYELPLMTFAVNVTDPPDEQISPLLGSDEIKERTV